MRLEIFTSDLSNRHEITHAISSQFSDLYNGIGKFSIVLPMDEYNISIAQNDALVYIVDRQLTYIVQEVVMDCDANEITMNGYSLNSLLDRRVIASEVKITNVETDVYSAVNANLRGLPVAIAESQGLTETVEETELDSDTLLTAIMPGLDEVELGQRATYDYKSKTITWGLYKGVDRTGGLKSVSFVHERGTAPGMSIDMDVSEYKNVLYCNAEYRNGSDTTKFTVTVGTADGADRREATERFGGDSQKDGESLSSFKSRVTRWAQEKLAELKNRLGFTMNADASELGTMYNVGDLVWCVSLRHNLKFKARVTGATYSQDANGKTISITVGDPVLTVNVR